MKPLLVNHVDARGGAARAAYRLHRALRASGVDSRLAVQIKMGDDEDVIGPGGLIGQLFGTLRPALDLMPLLAYRRRSKSTFYPGWLLGGLASQVRDLRPDVVHLHWITGAAVDVRSFRAMDRPLVWTLHDMWAFTGGCHYDEDCGKYASGCGRCPLLGSNHALDLSSLGWRRKQRGYRGTHLTIVAPSRWLAELARRSPLLADFPVTVIPNPIDTALFRPLDKQLARQVLRLPSDKRIILFGALRATSEPRKGFPLLLEALKKFGRKNEQCLAVIFGASQPSAPHDFGMPAIFLGTLIDDVSPALLYSAADVFVAPSTQENLSNTVLESLTCGTPVVAFSIGGMPDMIEHQGNGYLARPSDADDLAHGLAWVLENRERAASLAQRAREKAVKEFDEGTIAKRYLELYRGAIDTFRSKDERARS